MRVLFAGSPEIALPALERVAARHPVVGLLTNPPAPRGRGLAACCTPVAERAKTILPSVPVLSPERLGPAERQAVLDLRPDILVVYAYGRIFGPKFLSLFPQGGINVHPSLLPRWRGCAPIPYAILHQDSQTGVSVQRIALKMDSGDILARRVVPLHGQETTASLSLLAAEVGAELLVQVLDQLEAGPLAGEPQDEAQASYCHQLSKEEGRIDWKQPATAISAQVRAFNPWPLAWTLLRGQRLTVHACEALAAGEAAARPGTVLRVDTASGIMVQTGEGLLAMQQLQLAGKKLLGFKDFANGVRDLQAAVLGN